MRTVASPMRFLTGMISSSNSSPSASSTSSVLPDSGRPSVSRGSSTTGSSLSDGGWCTDYILSFERASLDAALFLGHQGNGRPREAELRTLGNGERSTRRPAPHAILRTNRSAPVRYPCASGRFDSRLALAHGDHVASPQQQDQEQCADDDEDRAPEEGDVEAVDERLRLLGRCRLGDALERVRGRARRKRREDREAERTPDLLRRVEETRGEPGVVGRDAARRNQRDRHKRET